MRRCSGWCAGWCRCPRCSRSSDPTSPGRRRACWSPRSCRARDWTSLLPQLGDQAQVEVGQRLGELLARLACMPMPRHGFFVDGDLTIEPMPESDLAGFVAAHRRGTALADWPADEYDALLEVADVAQTVLDRIDRTCLVHSDLNPKNVLVDPGSLEVTGLLDWEYAHAGLPGTDLGNLLRFDRQPPFADAVVATLPGARPGRRRRPPGHRTRGRPVRPGRPRGPARREPRGRARARPAARRGGLGRPARRTEG